MKLLLIIALTIFILYASLKTSIRDKLKENFDNIDDNDTSLIVDKVYKKNTDLRYMNNRTGDKIDKKEEILSNRLSPINDPKIGVDDYNPPFAYAEASKIPDNRIPDDNSNEEYYAIPLPEFDSITDNPITHNNPTSSKKIISKNVKNSKMCKFISAIDNKQKFQCPKEYPVHTGAKFEVKGNNIYCGDSKTITEQATVVGSISDGKLEKILIIKKGKGYTKNPKIKIIGGKGKGAEATATVKDGKLDKIVIKKSGSGYKSTPKIKVSKPDLSSSCNLCCKSEL